MSTRQIPDTYRRVLVHKAGSAEVEIISVCYEEFKIFIAKLLQAQVCRRLIKKSQVC